VVLGGVWVVVVWCYVVVEWCIGGGRWCMGKVPLHGQIRAPGVLGLGFVLFIAACAIFQLPGGSLTGLQI
jgi:hypothetical protein